MTNLREIGIIYLQGKTCEFIYLEAIMAKTNGKGADFVVSPEGKASRSAEPSHDERLRDDIDPQETLCTSCSTCGEVYPAGSSCSKGH